jgi:hypothetical protein
VRRRARVGAGWGAPGQQQTGEADKSGEGRESLKPEGGEQGKSQQEHAGPGPAGEAAEYGEPRTSQMRISGCVTSSLQGE